MSGPNYRFNCSVTDEATGETVIADYCALGTTGAFGQNEMADMHVASMLRAFDRKVRAEYEAREYPPLTPEDTNEPETDAHEHARQTLRTTLRAVSQSELLK